MVGNRLESLEFAASQSVCFAGPRPAKLPGGGENARVMAQIEKQLAESIRYFYAQGKRVFLNGCTAGFDVMAGETVLRLKGDCPEIVCVTVAPFGESYFAGSCWQGGWRERGLLLYFRSDAAFHLSKSFHRQAFRERDRFLADHACAVVCYCEQAGGGPNYMLDYAARKALVISNIARACGR